jgi:general secretion pathway protein K
MRALCQNRRCGAALMLSLWALFLLSAMLISWTLSISARLNLSGNANRSLEALAMASSGAEVGRDPQVKPGSDALMGWFGRDESYEVRITGEGGRLNLKWVLTPPTNPNPARLEILRKFLEMKGIDLNERDRMIDTLIDWVDPDNLVRLNGAEDEAGYKAANKMITRLEELKKIKGWEEFTSTKDWDADLTLDSNGPINLAWASSDVIMALPGMSEDRVEQFLEFRPGSDEIDGTEDDPFNSIPDALQVLGVPQPELAGLAEYIKNDTVQRIVSIGKSGDVTRTVRMVLLKQGNQGQLKSWKEL